MNDEQAEKLLDRLMDTQSPWRFVLHNYNKGAAINMVQMCIQIYECSKIEEQEPLEVNRNIKFPPSEDKTRYC